MTDTVERATRRTLVAFALVALAVMSAIYVIRRGWETGSVAGSLAAFGGGQADDAITLYMTQGQICEQYFREPFETCLVVMTDLAALTFSTHEAGRISVPAKVIIEHVKKLGYEVEDIAVIVHNHFTPAGFTQNDKDTYQYLKREGFRGAFGIWYTAVKRFVRLEDK